MKCKKVNWAEEAKNYKGMIGESHRNTEGVMYLFIWSFILGKHTNKTKTIILFISFSIHQMSSISLQFTPFFSPSLHQGRHFYKPLRLNPLLLPPPKPPGYLAIVRSLQRDTELLPLPPPPQKQTDRLAKFVSTAAGLFPLYITSGGIVACMKPSTFSWFVQRGPGSYSLALSLVMLAMGLTLELKDLFNLFMQRPLSVSFFFI